MRSNVVLPRLFQRRQRWEFLQVVLVVHEQVVSLCMGRQRRLVDEPVLAAEEEHFEERAPAKGPWLS